MKQRRPRLITLFLLVSCVALTACTLSLSTPPAAQDAQPATAVTVDLRVLDDGPTANTYLIEGASHAQFAVGADLVVYGEPNPGTEVAIALLKVIGQSPNSLTAQALLIDPENDIRARMRVDDQITFLTESRLVPVFDYAAGYLLRPTRIRLRPDRALAVGAQLHVMEFERINGEIIDALRTDTIMQITDIGESNMVAGVVLITGTWPITGTIVSLEKVTAPLPLPTACKLAIGDQDVDEIKFDLLTAAKREMVNEFFGEMIVASTAVENFVVTSEQIRTLSIGFVRVDGNAEFFNGKGFAEVCVKIQAYVTEEDKAKFIPEKLEKKYCDADEDMTTAQLIAYVKEEAVIQSLTEYNPKLKGADKESLLQLVQKVSYSANGFISDTQTYCVTFEGEVIPVETMAFLETSNDNSETPKPTPKPNTDPESTIQLQVDGIESSSYYNDAARPASALDGQNATYWLSKLGDVSGAWVKAIFRAPKTITRIGLYRQPNPEYGQVKEATLIFADGTKQAINLQGFDEWEHVDIEPVMTTSVTLEVVTVYPEKTTVQIVDLALFGQD